MKIDGINIRNFKTEDIEGIVYLWNDTIGEEFLYTHLNEESFKNLFLKNEYFKKESTFVAEKDNEIIGFSNGVYRDKYFEGENFESVPSYITMILVKKSFRRKGLGTELLSKEEKYFKSIGKSKINIDFFNPINISWNIPNTEIGTHPNAPGVDIESCAYKFFSKNGYIERSKMISMYRDLREFSLSDSMINKLKELKKENIIIEFYNKQKHIKLEEFFDELNNPYWKDEVLRNESKDKAEPLIVVAHNNEVIGFAGPLEREDGGRGRFTGIGVSSSYVGRGIGKLLFFTLCKEFSNTNVQFMSLFTGENNNAKRMYDAANFKEVRRWAIFSKKINI